MGQLRISNELHLTNRPLVKQCLSWLEQNHNAEIQSKIFDRTDVIYIINGDGIPEGNFNLLIKTLVQGVISIQIQAA